MKKLLALFAVLTFFFYACKNEKGQKNRAADKIDVVFECALISNDEIAPNSALYAIIDEGKTKIANLSICDLIPPEQYKDYQIPENAIAAAGGWWAGSGQYIYAIQKGDRIDFMQTFVEEMQEGPTYQYESIGLYLDGKFNLRIGNTLSEIVGIYTLGGHDNSWIFFLGMKENGLDAHFFELEGMLPPQGELLPLLSTLEPQILEEFKLNEYDLTFESSMGKGKFGKTEDGTIVTFFEKESHISDQLVLQKLQ